MISPPSLSNETLRLAVLREYMVLDSLPEHVLDDLTLLAAHICETPICLISIVDDHRQWFKSRVGLTESELPRDISFCGHTILQSDLFIVSDTAQDVRFADNPLVTGDLKIRFYAGAPLITDEGYALGTLCVIDRKPRQLTPLQQEALRVLGRQVMAQFDLRRHMRTVTESEERYRAIVESALDAIVTIDHESHITEFNPAAEKTFGRSRESVIGRVMSEVVIPERLREAHRGGMERYLETGQTVIMDRRVELTAIRADGSEFPIELTATRLGQTSPPMFTAFLRDITERQRTEEVVRESEQKLRKVIDGLGPNTFLGLMTPEGILIEANQPGLTAAGVRAEDVLGRPFDQTFWWAYSELVREQLRAAMARAAAGEASRYDVQVLVAGDKLVWIDFSLNPVHDANGRVIYLIPSGNIIDERKQAEQAVHASEARYRTLFEYAPDGILITDASARYLDANPSMCRMFGYTREEMLQLRPADTLAHEELERIGPALSEIKTGADHHEEWQCRRKNGKGFGAEVMATMMPDGNLLVMARDITDRKRADTRFRRLVDSNAQGVLFWDVKGDISEANDAFLEVVGYTREDLKAGCLNWTDMTPREFAALDRLGIEEIAKTGTCTPFEKEFIRKDGTRVPVLIGAAVFEDTPDEGVAFVLDLTERKKLEQQFLRSQRIESIGTLAGGIAHDLNNVLAPIIMSLELLRMNFTDPASQELLAVISASAQRGADMVRQVLSFARGVEGQRIEVQVKHIVGDIERIANETFLKHIQVRTIIPHDLWTLVGDPTQLHQVLLNLCVNARDAMPHGGALTISAANLTLDSQYAGMNLEAKPGPYIALEIEDSGTGMPASVSEKIFDPFFTTKEVGKGTGLGLSTTMAIVKSHSGFIRVYSEVGKGTKFRIYLPALTEASPAMGKAIAAEMPRGRGELILVVDDEAAVREVTRQTLEAFGYRVIVGADGVEAVAAYATHGAAISAVITDMMMPIMDGPATIQVLKKMNPGLPIIAASGLSVNGDLAQAVTLGVKHFLPKPFTAETLLKALRKALDK